MKVQVQIRSVYGEDKAYPFNHEAECLARIAGTKTLTRVTILNAIAMGCTLEEVDRHGQVSRTYEAGRVPSLSIAA